MIDVIKQEIEDCYKQKIRAIELDQLELASKYEKIIKGLKQILEQLKGY